jgi:hypothetical protein
MVACRQVLTMKATPRSLIPVGDFVGAHRAHRTLKVLYIGMTALCLMMVVWIFIFPASWLVGHSKAHDRIIARYVEEGNDFAGNVAPPEIVTKYRSHTLVQLTHNLPAAFWALAMPFQLHRGLRSKYRRLHRFIGYGMVFIGSIMMFGVGLILWRKITFEYSFPDLPPNVRLLGGVLNMHDSDVAMIIVGFWFLYTLFMGVYAISVRRDIPKHQRYMIRHVGAGIWVALQRVLLFVVYAPFTPLTRSQQRRAFGDAASMAIAITIILAEVAVWCLEAANKHKRGRIHYQTKNEG